VVAYGKILPRAVLDAFPRGCINVHASLLPAYRGAAPIQWAILSGDRETGVSIMRMTEELDAGDVLLARPLAIRPDHTGGTLAAELARLGATALGEAIDQLKAGTARATPQPTTGVTYAPRIERSHGAIDWRREAPSLERLVRALAPAPSAFTSIGDKGLKVHRARAEAGNGDEAPGTVLSVGRDGVAVRTGDGVLRLLEVQLEGRRAMPASAFAAGFRLEAGSCLGGT
jgi:methionyl-tRNA formyltransferase